MTYEVRTLRANADGNAVVGGRGFGVEILDGGTFGRENLIYFLGDDGRVVDAFAGDGFMRAVPGLRRSVAFDALALRSPGGAIADAVTVRVLREPVAGFVDSDPAGKPRWKYLARSTAPTICAAMTWLQLAELAPAGAPDRYSEQEEHGLVFWSALIVSAQPFDLYVFARPTPTSATRYCAQRFQSRNFLSLPAGSPSGSVGAYVVDLNTGTGVHTQAGTSTPIPVPPVWDLALWAYNPGVSDIALEWTIAAHG